MKIFDLWADVLVCVLINTSAPSHSLKSVAWPVGPFLKFRDIPDCKLFSLIVIWPQGTQTLKSLLEAKGIYGRPQTAKNVLGALTNRHVDLKIVTYALHCFFFFTFFSQKKYLFSLLCFLQKTIARVPQRRRREKRNEPWRWAFFFLTFLEAWKRGYVTSIVNCQSPSSVHVYNSLK